jgi:hypothetical protein
MRPRRSPCNKAARQESDTPTPDRARDTHAARARRAAVEPAPSLFLMCTTAPRSSSSRTTAAWPVSAAQNSGVRRSCARHGPRVSDASRAHQLLTRLRRRGSGSVQPLKQEGGAAPPHPCTRGSRRRPTPSSPPPRHRSAPRQVAFPLWSFRRGTSASRLSVSARERVGCPAAPLLPRARRANPLDAWRARAGCLRVARTAHCSVALQRRGGRSAPLRSLAPRRVGDWHSAPPTASARLPSPARRTARRSRATREGGARA